MSVNERFPPAIVDSEDDDDVIILELVNNPKSILSRGQERGDVSRQRVETYLHVMKNSHPLELISFL